MRSKFEKNILRCLASAPCCFFYPHRFLFPQMLNSLILSEVKPDILFIGRELTTDFVKTVSVFNGFLSICDRKIREQII